VTSASRFRRAASDNGRSVKFRRSCFFSSSRSHGLLVYLEASQRGATNARPIVALLSLFRGDEPVFETQPLPVVGGMDTTSKAIPIRFAHSGRSSASRESRDA
jgi:hypothetical protein